MFLDNYHSDRKQRFIANVCNINSIILKDIIEDPDAEFFNLFKYRKDIQRGKDPICFPPIGTPNVNEDGEYIYYILRGIRNHPSIGFNTKEELYLFLILIDLWISSFKTLNLFTKRRSNVTVSIYTFTLIRIIFGNRSDLHISKTLLSEIYKYILDKKRSRSNIPIYTKIISR